MGKKKGGKSGGDDYWDAEFEQDAEIIQQEVTENGNNAAVEQQKEEEEEEEIGGGGGGGLMAMMKKQQKKKKEKEESAAQAQTQKDGEDAGDVKVKSKKEKEKERKERQKLQKKKQTTATVGGGEGPAAVEDKKVDASTAASSASTAAAGKKKGAKKGGPPVAALREFLAAKQAAEEEQRQREEEERKREEERLRKLDEEEEQKAEERRLKKERERLKKEQLKKEGKWVSQAEKKKRQMAQQKLEAMRAAGMIVPGLEDDEEAAAPTRKFNLKDRAKKGKGASKKPHLEQEGERGQEEEEEEEEAEAEEQEIDEEPQQDKVKEVKEVADSWEDDEDVLDSWEEIGDEDAAGEKDANVKVNDDENQEDADEEDDSVNQGVKQLGISETGAKNTKEKKSTMSARAKKREEAKKARSKDNLRSPICVILGHVDTGKTKLLDKIRQTNVQEGEAGGITQQIGATYFPTESLQLKTEVIRKSNLYSTISDKTGFSQNFDFKVPGLLVIDTPGHESFTNLRSRGSSLCNIAILVVDIMHGLEPQTIESINLLKARKTPFIVALNKIDRIYDWKSIPDNSFLDSHQRQTDLVKKEFEDRLEATKVAFAEQGLNAELYTKNKDVRKYVSLVPTSAITGEGVPDLLSLLVQLTQNRLTDSLMYLSELEATVLEVKVVEGHGTTIDVILSNGVLHEGDRIVICGLNGPIVTNIRALLTPQPMKELRVKSAYVHHKEIKAAMGVKISASGLEKAIAGSRLLVVTEDDDEEELMDEVMADLTDLFQHVDKSGKGVCVQASTLGSLEALLSFLKDSKIPVAGINIGPVYRKDVLRASIMLEHAKEFATILAFDVKIDKEAQEYADEAGVRIFRADIIYHLFDAFTAYMKDIREERRKEMAPKAIWPCVLRIVPSCIFNKKDPIILGVDVVEGSVRLGTPICVPSKGQMLLGKVGGIEVQHKPVDIAKKGQQIAVRIEGSQGDQAKTAGKHFVESDTLVSMISRTSIDILKETFRDEVSKEEWLLIKKLKPMLNID